MKFNVNGREVESYELTNRQALDLFINSQTTDEDKQELESLIIDRFTHSLCPRQGEDNDDVFARFFGDFVNGKMHSKTKVAERMACEHRYLQNEMFKVCMEYIRKLSKNYDKGYFDGRNEYACKTSSIIMESLNKKDWPV